MIRSHISTDGEFPVDVHESNSLALCSCAVRSRSHGFQFIQRRNIAEAKFKGALQETWERDVLE